MENFRGFQETHITESTKLLTHIFKHYSFLGCGKCMPLSLTQIHTQSSLDITYSTAIKQAVHDIALKVRVNIKVPLLMNPHRTRIGEQNPSSFQKMEFIFGSMSVPMPMLFHCQACARHVKLRLNAGLAMRAGS